MDRSPPIGTAKIWGVFGQNSPERISEDRYVVRNDEVEKRVTADECHRDR